MSGLISAREVGTEHDPLARAINELTNYKRTRRVLFVEDDPEMRELFARYSTGFNCEVTYAGDGIEGAAKAISGNFDLIVLDIGLPGMDGIEVFAAIRGSLGDHRPPVAFLTGNLNSAFGWRTQKIGFACFIQKPDQFNLEYLTSFFHTFGITEKESAP